ncbi:hypothetical protein K491DRAFT_36679 [Lophiostoma macrostomum CBS 122681]|uniref:BTB domain-containing protein n=1 Tax=Lophiostoma macrostomum CBS 122681 TaxID=1314788 RepID=A0A6A6TL67_9PLEO|nr:hypothetical protein K491DRAFT_36679 [Lophiostoma macrostomum CBS 122681]
MFEVPVFPLGNVLYRSEYRYGPHRFKLNRSTMDMLSRKSSDFADDATVRNTHSIPLSTLSKKRPCYARPKHESASYMTAGLKKHFDDAQFSDLIVRCRDDEYHIHRVIMCSHSSWFSRVCAKASTESSIQTIDLSADDPDAVDAMLQYCYQLDYADKFLGLSSAGYTIYTLSPHVDIYLLAERYSIPGLKQLAVDKFEARASVLSRVQVNKDKFFHAIRVIYATTRSGENDLKRVAVRLCADHAEQYILQGGKIAAKVFKLMDEIPAFRMDFIKELAARLK